MGENTLYYGNNLDVLRQDIRDESVDLIYLDPPFNSQAAYNILFRSPTGEQSQAQIEAFEDTWHWTDEAEKAFDEVMMCGNTDAAEMLRAMRSFLKENDMMAYLAMMAPRLVELHRVLKFTGSIYLHCDPTPSHYLKILMDAVFGAENFLNEIIWQKIRSSKGQTKGFGNVHDTILVFSKTRGAFFQRQYVPLSEARLKQHYSLVEPETNRQYMLDNFTQAGQGPPRQFGDQVIAPPAGKHWIWSQEKIDQAFPEGRIVFTSKDMVRVKRYLDESRGNPIEDIWTDISPLNSQAVERLGYPTQKPEALLDRIIQASSNEGDIVLDPFCGCGTTIHAAQKLRRQWIGIDITHLAISLIEKRLNDAFPGITYEVRGTPKDLSGARALAAADKYQFQWWAVSLVNAVPYGGKKKGADTGIDGHIYFKPDGKTTEKATVSVKGGENVGVAMIRDLAHVVDRERAKIGVFITLAEPTRAMQTEAVKTGFYESPFSGKFPKIQILTIEELFADKKPQIPLIDATSFKKAKREDTAKQGKLF